MAEFKIGTTLVGMTSLESLTTPVPLPQYNYEPYSRTVILGSGKARGVGAPRAEWTFQQLTIEEYTQLRSFCPNASAEVFIRTKVDDDTYDDFSCTMIVAAEPPNRWFGNRRNYVISFRNLVAA